MITDILKLLFYLIKSILHPLNSNHFYDGKENNNIFNFVLTDSRKPNKINLYFNKRFLKEFYLMNMQNLEDPSKYENISYIFIDMNVFIAFFKISLANQVKSLIRQNERRTRVRDILNKQTVNEPRDDDEDETNESSLFFISDKRKNKIIDDDDEDEDGNSFE